MIRCCKLLIAAAILLSTLTSANSQTLISSPSSGYSGVFSDTVGYQFTVGSTSLQVTALGVYDSGDNGINSINTIGIWTNTGTLLSSVSIPAGTTATLNSHFRWATITPFTLESGVTYRIGAMGDYEDRYSGFIPQGSWSSTNYITALGSVRNNSNEVFSFPSSTPLSNQAVVGPNAMFTPIENAPSVPEPATYALIFGMATAILAIFYNRKF